MKSHLTRYIARRLLHMIPTLLGVILVTFILFNVVGGSPATQVLGKSAGARDLDDYDRLRGFDRPLFWGAWAKTRLFNPGQWGKGQADPGWGEGVEWVPGKRGVRLQVEQIAILPLAFEPPPGTGYRWDIRGRLAPGATDENHPAKAGGTLRRCSGELEPDPPGEHNNHSVSKLDGRPPCRPSGCSAELICLEGERIVGRQILQGRSGHIRLDFKTPAEGQALKFEVRVSGGTFEMELPVLRRALPHPWDSQLFYYLCHLARLDFGESVSTHQTVGRLLLNGLGPSLALAIPIFLITLTVSVALALVCAFTRDRWIDRVIVVTAVALMSVNYLVWIVLGQYGPAYRWGWFPIWGFESWRNLILPVWIGVLSGLGTHVRFYRTVMLDEIHRDYVRTAFAKGLSEGQVLFGHVLKNAAVPIITNAVMAIPFLYTGNLLLESFFGIPGLGGISVNAINSSDFDVIRAVVLIGAVLYVSANLVADLCYAWVDPRVRLG